MAERRATVASTTGMHARPANIFVQAAKDAGVAVTIGLPGQEPVDARSILSVMTLGAEQGTEVVLSATGEGAEQALTKLAEVLETNHDEPGEVA